jgi:hypothetical protein
LCSARTRSMPRRMSLSMVSPGFEMSRVADIEDKKPPHCDQHVIFNGKTWFDDAWLRPQHADHRIVQHVPGGPDAAGVRQRSAAQRYLTHAIKRR